MRMYERSAGLEARLGVVDAGRFARSTAAAEAVRALLRAGRLREALDLAEARLVRPLGADERRRIAGLQGLALTLVGRAEDGLAALADTSGTVEGAPQANATVLSCWAEAFLWSGLPRQAIVRADATLAADADADDRIRAVLVRAWAAVELEQAPLPIRIDIVHGSRPAVLAELRAIDAFARHAWHVAAAAFADAARCWSAWDAPRALVCRWGAGEVRRRAGEPDAADALRATLEAATAIGFEPLAARARRSLRLAGHRPAAPREPRSEPPPRGRLLTSRERQVLDLVERGRTNPEIARRLGLGRPTVARLLSNAMVKLGAESRAHAIVINATSMAAVAPADHATKRAAQERLIGNPEVEHDARSILARLATGRTLGAIATELGLSRRTADRRLADARAALGAQRTTEAVALAQRLGWLI